MEETKPIDFAGSNMCAEKQIIISIMAFMESVEKYF